MANASACRIGHDASVRGWHPASRVRCAGLRPPLTPAASQDTTECTHSKFKRGTNVYAEIDLEGKARALAKCDVTNERAPKKRWIANPDLMQFLRSL